MNLSKTACLRLGLVPAAILTAFGALAQTSTGSGSNVGGAPAPDAPNALERVTVSATKRLTFVQDTPLAVTALTQKDLERGQVKDLSSMLATRAASTSSCAGSARPTTPSWAIRPWPSMWTASTRRGRRARRC